MESRGLRCALALRHWLSLRHDLVTPPLRVIYGGVWGHPQTFNIRAWLERKAARVFRGRSCTKEPCTPGKWSFQSVTMSQYPTTQNVSWVMSCEFWLLDALSLTMRLLQKYIITQRHMQYLLMLLALSLKANSHTSLSRLGVGGLGGGGGGALSYLRNPPFTQEILILGTPTHRLLSHPTMLQQAAGNCLVFSQLAKPKRWWAKELPSFPHVLLICLSSFCSSFSSSNFTFLLWYYTIIHVSLQRIMLSSRMNSISSVIIQYDNSATDSNHFCMLAWIDNEVVAFCVTVMKKN